MRWLNVAGIITLLFATAFFLKYAYENSFIGPRGRVAIGILAGLAAIATGEIARRRGHAIFSQGLSGGGIAALYLSFFFSFRFYNLVEIGPAFALMALAAACGVALAVLQESLPIAILSFLGGYLTPVLLSTGQDAAGFLFSYLAILAAAALLAAWHRRWRALDILAFAGTWLLYGAWYSEHYERSRMAVALTGLAAFYLIFLVLPYVHGLARRRLSRKGDHVLAVANAMVTFGYLYAILQPVSEHALGFVALGLAAIYLALGIRTRRTVPEDETGAVVVFAISTAFLTMAVPLHLGLHGITIGWAVEALLLVYIGLRYRAVLTRAAGLIVFMLTILRLLIRHLPMHEAPFTLFANASFGTWAFVALAIFGASWLYRSRTDLELVDAGLPSWIPVAGALLLLAAINTEVIAWFDLWKKPEDLRAAAVLLVWVIFPWGVMAAGRRMRDGVVQGTGIVLAAASVIPFALAVEQLAGRYEALFGSAVFWTGVLGAASLWAVGVFSRRVGLGDPNDLPLAGIFQIASLVALLALLTVEVHTHFRLQPGTAEAMARNDLRATLSVSVLWALFATVTMAAGFRAGSRRVRYGAVGLFGLTLAKVFVLDIWELAEIYRVVSFVVLGLLLVGASFAYSRFRARIAMILLALLPALLAAGPARADFDAAGWKQSCEIFVEAGEASHASLGLDREVLEGAAADLSDLRVVGRGQRETPWMLWPPSSPGEIEAVPVKVLNSGVLPSRAATVELDLGGAPRPTSLVVRTAGDSFRRRVTVEGTDGGGRWVTLVKEGWLYCVPARGDAEPQRYEEIHLPENDFARLRVTVYPMADEKGLVDIRRVEAFRTVPGKVETEPLPVERSSSDFDPNDTTTRIDLDFGYRHARPWKIFLAFGEETYRRPFRVFGRNETRRTIRAGRTETGDPIMKEIEEPWQLLTGGVLERTPATKGGAEREVALGNAVARYVRILIDEKDNPPLTLRSVRAVARVVRILFPIRPGGEWQLYFGNPDARLPSYDLAATIPDPDALQPASARLGEAKANPVYSAEPEPPWSERHAWLLWGVLILAGGLLALIVARNLRDARTRSGSPR
ncbi:MAG TPA: DUF2339 domain-containing protein [Candidatus Saccharimonadales bacterium]|nr:DUF2339 domain-containing protein [Candidatus Saccharimonadales bacterium]